MAASCGKVFPLKTGGSIPAIGFGTWGGADDPTTVGHAVLDALRAGFRCVDCAECYGNEKEIGDALQEFLAEGSVPRSELFITSKVWNTNHAPEHVREACLNTLANLQLEYLDLYLVHWPLAWDYVGTAPFKDGCARFRDGHMAKVGLHQTWAAMESLVDEGKVKCIGVSNYNSVLLGDLLAYARIPPVVNQVEAHPYLQQRNLAQLCKLNGVVLEAYAPLGRPGQHKDGPLLLSDPAVVGIATKMSVQPAVVVLAWAIQRGMVPLPKSSNKERMAANLSALTCTLSDEDAAALDALEKGHHFCDYNWNYGCGLYD